MEFIFRCVSVTVGGGCVALHRGRVDSLNFTCSMSWVPPQCLAFHVHQGGSGIMDLRCTRLFPYSTRCNRGDRVVVNVRTHTWKVTPHPVHWINFSSWEPWRTWRRGHWHLTPSFPFLSRDNIRDIKIGKNVHARKSLIVVKMTAVTSCMFTVVQAPS